MIQTFIDWANASVLNLLAAMLVPAGLLALGWFQLTRVRHVEDGYSDFPESAIGHEDDADLTWMDHL